MIITASNPSAFESVTRAILPHKICGSFIAHIRTENQLHATISPYTLSIPIFGPHTTSMESRCNFNTTWASSTPNTGSLKRSPSRVRTIYRIRYRKASTIKGFIVAVRIEG
ncbi:hypothetical protein EJ08DRAFT_237936 [Tothia fuscella]|uniref:Uncharacterized protein n=1 Tax=Tothia fuscella TaxID=1048955 RepID=A0A9P4TXP4_9PEZI|nr:hypothetical protein EJ08DRAFT_237936 [Tothia fuscella]